MKASDRKIGKVTLIGAGPGDAGLITVKGLSRLREAEVVVFDRLIGPELLDEARSEAELIDAGKSPAPGKQGMTQEEINAAIVSRALEGRRVARLKGGDPYIYGRGWEEMRACWEAGVECEVVAGVTSAIAAPMSAGIPVTARGVARTFAIVTPQSERGAERMELDYRALSRMDTVSVLMGRAMLGEVVAGFVGAGKDAATPAAVIQDGTLGTERSVHGRLGEIESMADRAGIGSPAVVVIGATAGYASLEERRARDPGREKSGLWGKRIVVTRPRSASGELIAELRERGARVINSPLIEIEYREVKDREILRRGHEWIVFTSLHGVRGFWRALRGFGLDARAAAGMRVAAVGPKTAEELGRIGIVADVVPGVHRASALVEALAVRARAGSSILFPCGTLAREELRHGLTEAGLRVEEMAVYDTVSASPGERARREMEAGVDAILFYAPSAVRSAVEAGLELSGALVGCIGPTTAEAARGHGLEVAVVAEAYSDAGLLTALERAFSERVAGGAA